MTRQTKADIAILAAAALWGGGYYFLDLSLEVMGVFTVTGLRFLAAFLLLLAVLNKRLVRVSRRTLWYSAAMGVLMAVIYIAASFGLRLTTQSNAGFLCALAVVFVPLIGRVFLGRRLTRKMLFVLIVTFAGVALLTIKETLTPQWGDLLCIASSILYAVYLLVAESAVAHDDVDALQIGVYQMLFGGVMNLLLAFLLERDGLLALGLIPPVSWVYLAILSVFCTVFPFVVQPIALQYTSASRAGVMFTAEPLVTALVAFVFVGEVLRPWNYVGMLVLLLALLLMEIDLSKLKKRRKSYMPTTVLGKTGLTVSRIGFGGIPIQRIGKDAIPALFDKLLEHGVNFIDTARGYTVSEEWIGCGIAGRRERFVLASKSPVTDAESMRADIERSLGNLGTEYIDLYQMHNMTLDRLKVCEAPGGALEALIEARDAGKVGHIGVTLHGVEAFAYAVTRPWVETIMFPYNLVETQGEALIAECKARGIGFIAMKPLAGGAIDDGAVALKFVLRNDGVSVAIPGMYTEQEIEENTAAARDLAYTAAEQEKADAYRKALDGNFCRRCDYCQPCTAGIFISRIFTLDSYYTRYGLKDWAKPLYRALPQRAHDCVDCGLCEERCPYRLPIRRMLKTADEHMEGDA